MLDDLLVFPTRVWAFWTLIGPTHQIQLIILSVVTIILLAFFERKA